MPDHMVGFGVISHNPVKSSLTCLVIGVDMKRQMRAPKALDGTLLQTFVSDFGNHFGYQDLTQQRKMAGTSLSLDGGVGVKAAGW